MSFCDKLAFNEQLTSKYRQKCFFFFHPKRFVTLGEGTKIMKFKGGEIKTTPRCEMKFRQ